MSICSLFAPTYQPASCHATTGTSCLAGRENVLQAGWSPTHCAVKALWQSSALEYFGVCKTSFTEQSRNLSQCYPMLHTSCQYIDLSCTFSHHALDSSCLVASWLQIWHTFPIPPSRPLSTPCHDTPLSLLSSSTSLSWFPIIQHDVTAPLPSLSALLADHLQPVQMLTSAW